MKNLNELRDRVKAANVKWWTDLETGLPIKRNKGELLALVISELSEALEGERKDLMDDHLPDRRMAEVEMGDCCIRILDYAGGFNIDIDEYRPPARDFPENKAEGIYEIMRQICANGGASYHWIEPCISMIEKYCSKHGYDLWGAVESKLEYNKSRKDHTHEARKEANGKKF